MPILAFQKPDKVIMLDSTATFGRFEFRPLEPGFGITIGNALRRILLSSLEGFAITSVKIAGVDHEFASKEGVMEDVIDILLNLKQVRLIRTVETADSETVTVNIGDQTEVTAGSLSAFMTGFKVLNPELVICRMAKDTRLQMELTIAKGRGYIPAEENQIENSPIGTIALDSIHTPIKNVKYVVENYRVEGRTDYEKLVFEITTDGSISPKESLKEAAKILIFHFQLFSDEKITAEVIEAPKIEEFDDESLHMRTFLATKLSEHDLSVRALNCLKTAEVETLGDLVRLQRSDLMKFRNFGKKSLTELDELLEKNDLTFGMDINKYKLDKE